MKLLATSVIRLSKKKAPHGCLYLIDLEKDTFETIISYDDPNINWEGRGGSRGLRGIAFYHNKIFIAAADKVLIFNRKFKQIGTIAHPKIKQIHELSVTQNKLYITSTDYDAVGIYSLDANIFVTIYCFRNWHKTKRAQKIEIKNNSLIKQDTVHVNNVYSDSNGFYVSGLKWDSVIAVPIGKPQYCYTKIPTGTHNAEPYKNGIIFNHTVKQQLVIRCGEKKTRINVPIPEKYVESNPAKNVVPGWNRGLCYLPDGKIAVGSAPGSIHIFDGEKFIKSIQLTEQTANAIHGLEVWPY